MKHSVIKLFIVFLVLGSCSKDEEVKKYNLNTTIAPIEGGTVSPASGTFDSGETFTLTATPLENYEFSNWSGNATGATNTVSVTMDSDKNIVVSFKKKDTDGDGITDDLDTCSDTPSGEPVDPNGCAGSQKDADGDGVIDDQDSCSDTPSGETVDSNGCSDSQKDTDGDGITDDLDTCPNTPSGESVDTNGCSTSQTDTDGDGVTDDIDTCPDTPSGETVDTNGCSDSQKDTDGDGVTDDIDTCIDTPSGETVDSNGCSDSQKDLSGIYSGLFTKTSVDVWLNSEPVVIETVTSMIVTKYNEGYLTQGNVPLNIDGYGIVTTDSRDECPYDTCQPRDSWYMIHTQTININDTVMEWELIQNQYSYEGTLMSTQEYIGNLEKQ